MRPSLLTAIVATAMLGGGHVFEQEHVLSACQDAPEPKSSAIRLPRSRKARVATSQRQIRKDRRRRWAAGDRFAFSR